MKELRRGKTRSGFGVYRTLQTLVNDKVDAANSNNADDPEDTGDYTDHGNPELIKFQQQEDDKTGSFLSKVWNTTDFGDYDDGYGYFDNSFQKLVLQLGLNAKPTVVSEADFNAYVQQTGAEVKYRGVSGQDAVDRFRDADHNHTGSGRYGDGHYFSNSRSVAENYARSAAQDKYMRDGTKPAPRVMKMALSPTARVIDYSTLQRKMAQLSPKLQRSLSKAGSIGQNSFGPNSGEAQLALKLGYNCIRVSSGPGSYEIGLTRDAFIVSRKTIRIHP